MHGCSCLRVSLNAPHTPLVIVLQTKLHKSAHITIKGHSTSYTKLTKKKTCFCCWLTAVCAGRCKRCACNMVSPLHTALRFMPTETEIRCDLFHMMQRILRLLADIPSKVDPAAMP